MQIEVPFDYARAHAAIGPKPGTPDGSLASYGAALTMAPGAPWALCITPPPNQVLYSADAFPGRIYKLSTRWESAGRARRNRQETQAVRMDPRDRLPVGERALRGRVAQLAGAEADFASTIPMTRQRRPRTHGSLENEGCALSVPRGSYDRLPMSLIPPRQKNVMIDPQSTAFSAPTAAR